MSTSTLARVEPDNPWYPGGWGIESSVATASKHIEKHIAYIDIYTNHIYIPTSTSTTPYPPRFPGSTMSLVTVLVLPSSLVCLTTPGILVSYLNFT